MLNQKVLKCQKMLHHMRALGGQLSEEHWPSDYYLREIGTNNKNYQKMNLMFFKRENNTEGKEPEFYPSRLSSIAALY